jgi:NAD(P) transhydrogenase subunit alpha
MTDSVQQLLEKAQAAAENAQQMAQQAQHYSDQIAQASAVISGHASGGGMIDPVIFRLAIFVLAVFVGYYVVWSVTPALHTPLMSVTNAISSVIVVGALVSTGVEISTPPQDGENWARWLGFIALILACVNIFGGFLVTERMLAMYKKKG